MPALDLGMIDRLGRDLHTTSHSGLMAEDEVCPWTLFLTMALTLLKGVLPHVPRMLPVFISDPELRAKAAETFNSEEFQDNIENYFVENIKSDIQTPLNRQIIKSSETVMYAVDMMNGMMGAFMGLNPVENNNNSNDEGTTDNKPRMNNLGGNGYGGTIMQLAKFVGEMYQYI